jgi:hypothetical protein
MQAKLSAYQQQRLYANPSSCGYLLASPPVLLLALVKALVAGLAGGTVCALSWMGYACLLLPAHCQQAYSAIVTSRCGSVVLSSLSLTFYTVNCA